MSASRILRTLGAQFVAELTSKILPLIILHVVVARLGAEGFGTARFGFGLIDTMVPFIVFGYLGLATVELGIARDDRQRRDIIWEIVGLKLCHALIMSLVLGAIVLWVPGYEAYQTVVWALMFLLLTTAFDMHFVHVGTARLFSFNMATTVIKLVSFLLVLWAVQDEGDVVLFAVLNFGTNGVVSLFSLIVNTKRYGFQMPTVVGMTIRFKRSLPYVVMAVSAYALTVYDLYVVEAWFDAKGAGLYGGVQQICFAITNALAAMNLVFFSEVVSSKSKAELTRLVDLGLFGVLVVVMPIVVGVWFVDEALLLFVLNTDFVEMAPTFSVLVCGVLGQALIFVFGTQVLLFKREVRQLNLVMGVAIGGAAVLSLVLVGPLQYLGIGIGNAAGRWLAGFVALWFARRHLDHLPWRDIASLLAATGIMAGALALSPWVDLLPQLLMAIIVYTAALLLLNRQRLVRLAKRIAPQLRRLER